MKILLVKAEEVRPLRHLVLRPGQSVDTTYYELDCHEKTIHLAAILNKQVISIATLYPENDLKLKSKNGYRLRGMATHPKYRRNSAATNLMLESFILLKNKNCDVLWCNARLNAVDFYQSLGFKKIGPEFDIKDIGPHYKMWKLLV
jgi:predicted GNAT family N-acyltransferase|tara:strand:+ start:10581 stop:11018 length:438 start_codon:yes stop_codon:yes gene_type:complete